MICRWFRETYKNGEDTDIFLRQLLFVFFRHRKSWSKDSQEILTMQLTSIYDAIIWGIKSKC